MAMRVRKTPRKPRRKVVKVQFHPRPPKSKKPPDPMDPYQYIDEMVAGTHDDLKDAKIAVAWMLDVKADRDGHLKLGACKKATDLDREFRDFDLVIMLNSAAWKSFDPKRKLAVIDHYLCRAAVSEDKNGDPIFDERDRKCYRPRRPDIEEFKGVISRHGLYMNDLVDFFRAASETPLFNAAEKNGDAKE
jgi:hypothetical protein